MPSHQYICENCKQVLDIYRNMKDTELPPQKDEEVFQCIPEGGEHTWKKQFAGSKYQMVRGKNWNYRKGNP